MPTAVDARGEPLAVGDVVQDISGIFYDVVSIDSPNIITVIAGPTPMRWVSTDFSKVAKIVPEKPKEVICVGCKLKNDHAEPNRPNGVYVCYDCRETDRDPDHLKEGPKGVSAGRNFIQFFGHDSFGGASSWGDP